MKSWFDGLEKAIQRTREDGVKIQKLALRVDRGDMTNS